MHTKESIKQQLTELGITTQDTVLVHSSMRKIGEVEGGAETILDALSEYLVDGLLVLPTHTWEKVNQSNPYFNVNESESCVGVLTNIFRKRDSVYRSLHPTHSVAALGKDAYSFTNDDHKFTTPCAKGSSLSKLIDRKGKILLVGVDFTSNTFIHGVEEWNDIPGRLTEDYEQLYAVTDSRDEISIPSRRHVATDYSAHYWKVEEALLKRGTITKGQLGSAEATLCDATRLNKDLSRVLKEDKDLFSRNEPLHKKQRDAFSVLK